NLLDVETAAHHDADLGIASFVEGGSQATNEGGIDPVEIFFSPGLRVADQPLFDQSLAGVDANRVQGAAPELVLHGPGDLDRGADHVVVEIHQAHDLHPGLAIAAVAREGEGRLYGVSSEGGDQCM